jgi:hypothetical protein
MRNGLRSIRPGIILRILWGGPPRSAGDAHVGLQNLLAMPENRVQGDRPTLL